MLHVVLQVTVGQQLISAERQALIAENESKMEDLHKSINLLEVQRDMLRMQVNALEENLKQLNAQHRCVCVPTASDLGSR